MIDSLKEQYDTIIVDTPRFAGTADARVITNLCDGTLMVALKGKTSQSAFGQAKKQMEDSGVRVLGAVFNEKRGARG